MIKALKIEDIPAVHDYSYRACRTKSNRSCSPSIKQLLFSMLGYTIAAYIFLI